MHVMKGLLMACTTVAHAMRGLLIAWATFAHVMKGLLMAWVKVAHAMRGLLVVPVEDDGVRDPIPSSLDISFVHCLVLNYSVHCIEGHQYNS